MLGELLLGFGPAILLVGLFWFLARRAKAGGGAGAALGSFGRSQARRVDPRRSRSPSTMWPASTRRRGS